MRLKINSDHFPDFISPVIVTQTIFTHWIIITQASSDLNTQNNHQLKKAWGEFWSILSKQYN